MPFHRIALPVITAIVVSGPGGTATPATASPDLIYSFRAYAAVREVNDSLNQIGWPGEAAYNHYQNVSGASSVVWGTPGSPTTYEAKAQCAPLVTIALKRVYDWADASYFSTNFGSSSPTSAQYFDKLNADALPHMVKRTRLSQLVPGDLIAIKYAGADSANGDPTGHMAFYVGRQAVNRDGDAGTLEWAVTVVDSTRNPHGDVSSDPGSPYWDFPDTRAANGVEYDGLGKGTMVFRTDVLGNILGYWWGINENPTTQWHPIAERPVVFGHVTEAS